MRAEDDMDNSNLSDRAPIGNKEAVFDSVFDLVVTLIVVVPWFIGLLYIGTKVATWLSTVPS